MNVVCGAPFCAHIAKLKNQYRASDSIQCDRRIKFDYQGGHVILGWDESGYCAHIMHLTLKPSRLHVVAATEAHPITFSECFLRHVRSRCHQNIRSLRCGADMSLFGKLEAGTCFAPFAWRAVCGKDKIKTKVSLESASR
jgi:hypothetical protein